MSAGDDTLLSMGPHTFQVSVNDIFGANRRKLVEALLLLCDATATASVSVVDDHRDQHDHKNRTNHHKHVIIFLKGGESATRFDSDHEPIFRQESYFWWLCGVTEPDCSISIDIDCTAEAAKTTAATTTLYVPRLSADYATVMGKIRSLEEWKDLYRVDAVKYADEIETSLLADLQQKEGSSTAARPTLLLMKGPNSDSGKMYEPPVEIQHHANLAEYVDCDTLFPVLAECRVCKSAAELLLLRYVTEVTSFAHAYVMRNFKPGMHEYQAESLFRHYCHYNYGARLTGYAPICGCGPDAAVLHYGHAGEPNARQCSSETTSGDGDSMMCLFDMGAEYYCYGSDVTCSFPAGGVFSDRQRVIYAAVCSAQVAVYALMRPGVSWVECHRAAEAALLGALVAAGLVRLPRRSSVRDLVELRLGAVFMPHGLGHLLGIDTHDVGGYLPGHPARIPLPGLAKLRTARLLRADMVLTVEPGCYFIDHLLDEALASPVLGECLNAAAVNAYRGFGGVRLEDVVQVTDTGVVNYTLCPRTVAEVESVMAGGKWPPVRDEAPELRRVRLTDPTPLPSPPSL